MAETKPHIQSVRFSGRMVEMVEQLMNEQGFATVTSLIHEAVRLLYKSYYPPYKSGTTTSTLSPKEKARRKKEERDALKETAREEQKNICVNSLEGTVVSKDGTDYCDYYTYSFKNRYAQHIPLEQVTEGLAASQYSPSEARVKDLQERGDVDYPVPGIKKAKKK